MGARLDPGVFVEVARAAADLSAYESVVLEELDRRIGIDSGFFMRRREPGPTGYGLFDDARRRACAGRWGVYTQESRVLPSIAQAGDGIAIDLEVFGRTELTGKAYYREIMAPISGRSTMFAFLSRQGRRVGTLVLGRARADFRPSERRRISTAIPTLSVCEAVFSPAPSVRRAPSPEGLSRREREIVDLLRLGYTNREIALALGTSPNTVRNQLRRIFERLGASTRAEAVARSLGHTDDAR